MENEINLYVNMNIKKWEKNQYIGFFKFLKEKEKELLKCDECSWGYVPNASGGFMGFW